MSSPGLPDTGGGGERIRAREMLLGRRQREIQYIPRERERAREDFLINNSVKSKSESKILQ